MKNLTAISNKDSVSFALNNALQKTLLATSIVSIIACNQVVAQESEADASRFEEAVLVVSPRVLARERVDSVNPVLSYDVEFFQRFEPTNLQEMLKRVPGINVDKLFASSENFTDTEAINFGFRGGFGDGAGQILINGRRVPGVDTANAVAFSSIPSELVQEIQVIRATSADIDAQGYGLTINILLKDGSNVPEGKFGSVRVNARSVSGEAGGNVSGTFAGRIGNGYKYSMSYSFEEDTRNTDLFIDSRGREFGEDSPVVESFFVDDTMINQSQTGINLTLSKEFVRGGKFDVHSYLFDKDRDDDTDSLEILTDETLSSLLTNREDLSMKGLAGKVVIPFFADSESNVTVNLSYDKSEFDYVLGSTFDSVIAFNGEEFERSELKFVTEINFLNSASVDFSIGLSGELNEMRLDTEESFDAMIGDPEVTARSEALDQSRFDAYMMYDVQMSSSVLLSLGYRYETTMNERSSAALDGVFSRDAENSLVSGSLWWKARDNQDIRFSYSENVFRPDEVWLLPGLYSQNGFNYIAAGNSVTHSKFSTVELNYDYHFAKRRGIFGISIFDKRSTDLPDFASLEGEDEVRAYITENQPYLLPLLDAQADSFFPVENIEYLEDGDFELILRGVEIDFSIPMAIIGLPNLSVSSNISYFERQFEDDEPSESTSANLSIDHKLGGGFSYGFSYNTKSDEDVRFVSDGGEVIESAVFERDPGLDVFVEKRFGESFLLRLVAENLTDASDQRIESERFTEEETAFASRRFRVNSDPSYQLILRAAF